ncbi:MAG: acyl-CoA thioesterase, partial [Bacteroidetes bacterium]|nr:acyl-CoA thioesterase [Bacteroidota bacterium]
PIPVPPVKTDSLEEAEAFEAAGRRRQFRLFTAGRLGDDDIQNLQEYIGSIRHER